MSTKKMGRYDPQNIASMNEDVGLPRRRTNDAERSDTYRCGDQSVQFIDDWYNCIYLDDASHISINFDRVGFKANDVHFYNDDVIAGTVDYEELNDSTLHVLRTIYERD